MIKKIFLIGGMSESGKSTLGRYFESKGIPRLKIVDFLKRVKDREDVTEDFVAWNNRNVKERPEWVHKVFTDEFIAVTTEQGIECCALESLYGPDLALYMKSVLGDDRVIVVYVDMDVNVRLQRQMIRENLTDLEEAKALLFPRDERKREWRVPDIEPIADVVIDNSGSIQELYDMADKIMEEHCPEKIQ